MSFSKWFKNNYGCSWSDYSKRIEEKSGKDSYITKFMYEYDYYKFLLQQGVKVKRFNTVKVYKSSFLF